MDDSTVSSLILRALQEMPNIDWIVTITAIIYIFLAARENIWCWFFGIISCSTWAYSSLVNYQLYLDAIVNVFYVIMAFVGIYQWRYGSNKSRLPITTMRFSDHWKVVLIGMLGGVFYGYLFDEFTAAEATYLDALTTVFALLTTVLVIQKKLENWLYWIAIDLVYIHIYISRGAFLFVVIMLIYIGIAISGYINWRKKIKV